jgi:H/ACA ribonucleoprotein complex subunit 1
MQEGMLSTSFKKDDKVYIGGDKLLPIERFLPKPKAPAAKGDSAYPSFLRKLDNGQRLISTTASQRRRGAELLAVAEVLLEAVCEVDEVSTGASF